METEKANGIKTDMQSLYPELFDDPSAVGKLDALIKQAAIKCTLYQQFEDAYPTLVMLYTAYLLASNQQADGNVTSVKADVFQVNLGTAAGPDSYLQQFYDLLMALGVDDEWKVQLL